MYFDKLKKPFFIAEMSGNHNGTLSNAKKLINHAKKYGADAIKLQTYTPDTMTLKSRKKEFLIKEGLWKGYNLWSLFEKAKTLNKTFLRIFCLEKQNSQTPTKQRLKVVCCFCCFCCGCFYSF